MHRLRRIIADWFWPTVWASLMLATIVVARKVGGWFEVFVAIALCVSFVTWIVVTFKEEERAWEAILSDDYLFSDDDTDKDVHSEPM